MGARLHRWLELVVTHEHRIELVLLILTGVAFLALLTRSLITGDDIPTGWGYLIGMSWGGLLGLREVMKRPGGGRNAGD